MNNQWQPMTSAPQDGKQILVKERNGAVSIAAWIEDDDGKLVQQWRAFAQGWAIVELSPNYDGQHVELDPVAWAAIPTFSEMKP